MKTGKTAKAMRNYPDFFVIFWWRRGRSRRKRYHREILWCFTTYFKCPTRWVILLVTSARVRAEARIQPKLSVRRSMCVTPKLSNFNTYPFNTQKCLHSAHTAHLCTWCDSENTTAISSLYTLTDGLYNRGEMCFLRGMSWIFITEFKFHL